MASKLVYYKTTTEDGTLYYRATEETITNGGDTVIKNVRPVGINKTEQLAELNTMKTDIERQIDELTAL